MQSAVKWKTAITKIEPNKIQIRGYRVDELMGRVSFPQAIYLILKGDLPSENVGKLIDAMLVSSIDHGASPLSTLAAINIASSGAPLNAALAGGILAISKYHGGAIENCMRELLVIKKLKDDENFTTREAVEEFLSLYREQKKRVSGFGHRIHTSDPRTQKLFQLAQELGIAGEFVEIAKTVEELLEKSVGRKLPINVDGAIAALLCELQFPPELANAFFIMSRLPGLVAHIYEEYTRYKPMRVIHPTEWEYDGPKERRLELT